MEKLFCEKCESFTKSINEVTMFKSGELDNRCPVCGGLGCVILIEENTEDNIIKE
jgi:hypothetical protein